jgi:TerB-C domain
VNLTRLRTVGAPARGYAIPSPPAQEKPRSEPVMLDPELIRTRLAETERASSILAEIFTGEDTSSFSAVAGPVAPGASQSEGGDDAGLDESHRAFLARLADRPRWRRSEVDGIAGEFGLLPDGALEIVNEAAFEAVGEPVCEGTDPIQINTYALKEMLG